MTTPSPAQQEVTQLLGDWSGGDEGALEKLIPLVQPELHRLAHHYMSRERAGHTLQTTALLDEAYLRLVDDRERSWQNRTHFFAVAAQLMRRIMVDHARQRQALALTTPNTVRFPPFTFFGVRSLGSGTVSTVPLPIVEPDWLLVWFPGLGRTTPNTIRRKSQNNAQH